MKSRKGFSPLIAAVFLIALTMAVAHLFNKYTSLEPASPQAASPDADIVVTQNESRLDELLVQKGDYYCGVIGGAWNEEIDTKRCVELLQNQDLGDSEAESDD